MRSPKTRSRSTRSSWRKTSPRANRSTTGRCSEMVRGSSADAPSAAAASASSTGLSPRRRSSCASRPTAATCSPSRSAAISSPPNSSRASARRWTRHALPHVRWRTDARPSSAEYVAQRADAALSRRRDAHRPQAQVDRTISLASYPHCQPCSHSRKAVFFNAASRSLWMRAPTCLA